MKALVMAAASLICVCAADLPHAVAESCGSRGSGGGGGGGGGGGQGGGGQGGGGESFVAGASASRDECKDTSDIVGYRRCTRFGAWSKDLRYPPVVIEGGAVVRQFASLLDGQGGTLAHEGESFAYRAAAQTSRGRAIDTAVLSTIRASVGLPLGLYTALEVDLGGIAQPGPVETEMTGGVFGSPELEQRRGFIVDSLAAVGVRGAVGPGRIAAELAGGVRAISYSFRSAYHDCIATTSITAVGPIAEARARGELWISPWLSAGITVGTSVIENRAWMGGLYIGVHTRAFGGGR